MIAFNAPIATMAGFMQLSIGYGNGVGAPVSFLVAGAILLMFSAGFVGMSHYIDNPGAFYKFVIAGLGKSWGLAGAFMATTAYLLLCIGAYFYLGYISVDFVTRTFGDPIFSWEIWTLIFLGIITTLGLMRIDLSVKILGALVLLEVAMVALWQLAVIWQGGPEGYAPESFAASQIMSGSPGLGILFAMLTMVGVESAACFRDETKDPEKSVGRATYIGIAFLAVFYCIGNWAYIVTQGPSHAVQNALNTPVESYFASVEHYLGNVFAHATSLIVVTSQIISINAVQGAASRYLHSLGRSGILPARLGGVHQRLQSPHVAVLTVAAMSLVAFAVVFAFGVKPVAAYAGLTGMGIYVLLPLLVGTSISVIAFYRKNTHHKASAWIRVIAPFLSAVALAVLFVLTTLNLKVLVGTEVMVVVSIVAVAAVPICGWCLALGYRRYRPVVYAAIGSH
jgi:amino acid transporter